MFNMLTINQLAADFTKIIKAMTLDITNSGLLDILWKWMACLTQLTILLYLVHFDGVKGEL